MTKKSTEASSPKSGRLSTAQRPLPNIYIKRVATVRLQYTTEHYAAFRVYTHDLKKCWLLLKAKDAGDPKKIGAAVLTHDLYHEDLSSLEYQAKVAARAKPSRKGTIAISNGWLDRDTFIFSDRVISRLRKTTAVKTAAERPLIIACPDINTGADSCLAGRGVLPSDLAAARAFRGTLDAWQTEVATPALQSSPMALGLVAVFAAPLLTVLDRDPFILYFAGHTSGGKTTALLPPASAIGINSKSRLPSWKHTDSGFEGWAHIEFPDMAFPIDELSHLGGDPQIFDKLDEAAYMFDAGVNKKKNDRVTGNVSGRPRRTSGSKSIVIASYEKTLSQIERDSGKRFRPGVRVRIVEVPMSINKHAEGIFDNLPNKAGNGEARTKYAENLTKQVRSACRRNSGKVFAAFIRSLVHDLKASEDYVRARIDWFLQTTNFDRSRREEYRLVDHFALLYGAGAYAIKLGLLPWSRLELLRAVRQCHRASRNNAAGTASEAPITTVGKQLTPDVRLSKYLADKARIVPVKKAAVVKDMQGWKKIVGANTEYFIKSDVFRGWFPVAAERRSFEKLLVSQGQLKSDGKTCSISTRVPNSSKRVPVYKLVVPTFIR